MNALVLRADAAPMAGVACPGPHQIYRRPQLRVEPRPLGPLPPGYLRVEMRLVGICGTDLHVVKSDPSSGYILCSSPLGIGPEGRVLGHEGIGEVREVGAGVTSVRPGDLVTFESLSTCRQCEPCRQGRFNQCTNVVLLGMQQDGLFAEIADVPAWLAHPVNDLAGNEPGRRAAACIEPAACSLVALESAHARPGEEIVILGAGPIGLFAAMLARLALGAATVVVVEPLPFRRELARRWADRVHDVDEFFAQPARRPADVLFDTSGSMPEVDRSLLRLGPNARVVLLARSGKPLTVHSVDHVITNSISIIGSRGHLGGAFDRLLRLCREGRLPLHEAVTGVVHGLGGLRDELEAPEPLAARHCKVLAQL
jgi:(R,R)-butanediol dehydrogenase/meso-butanediol dehydrogenase/diacetyl reductase